MPHLKFKNSNLLRFDVHLASNAEPECSHLPKHSSELSGSTFWFQSQLQSQYTDNF